MDNLNKLFEAIGTKNKELMRESLMGLQENTPTVEDAREWMAWYVQFCREAVAGTELENQMDQATQTVEALMGLEVSNNG